MPHVNIPPLTPGGIASAASHATHRSPPQTPQRHSLSSHAPPPPRRLCCPAAHVPPIVSSRRSPQQKKAGFPASICTHPASPCRSDIPDVPPRTSLRPPGGIASPLTPLIGIATACIFPCWKFHSRIIKIKLLINCSLFLHTFCVTLV